MVMPSSPISRDRPLAQACTAAREKNEMLKQESPVWLMTGCSTGLGHAPARLVIDRGFPGSGYYAASKHAIG